MKIPIAGVRVGHWTGPSTGVTVLLADQNLMFARAVADRALVMERGRLVHAASRAELQGNDPALHRFLAV